MSATAPVIAASAWPRRLLAYSRERFPVPAYGLLTALYVGGGWAVARRDGGSAPPPARLAAAIAVVLLVFFHLRVFDEFKDFERDEVNHPERLVQRGVVGLDDLWRWGGAALGLEALLAAWLGGLALAVWAAVAAYSALMRVEFFAGRWLERRPFTYALTHQPIMLPLSAFVYAAAGLPLGRFFDAPMLMHQAVSLGGMFAFEVARKLRSPEDELVHELTYTTVHGPALAAGAGAALLLGAVAAEAFLLGAWALAAAAFALPFAAFALRPTRAAAKQAHLAVSLALLLLHGALALGRGA